MNFAERNPLSVSSLTAAVENDTRDVLQDLIKKGRNVNIIDNRGWTPLHEAALLDHIECIKILLEAGARVNATTHQGETPLFIACKNKNLESVKLLLNWDNNIVNFSNNESVTPLHIACAEHCVPVAKLLIENDALINAEDNSGITPLHEAVMSKDVEICKLLIENGANLSTREYDGNLAFHFACMIGNTELLEMLFNCYSGDLTNVINAVNCDGFTPLMLAVQAESIGTIKELLKRGADANIVDKDKTLALHLAVHTGNLEVLKCIFNATSKDAIIKHCTVSQDILDDECVVRFPIKSLVCLAIDSECIDCLEFILTCGLSYDVLNCPILVLERLPTFFHIILGYASYTDVSYIHGERQALVLYPISFLLKEKMSDLGSDTIKYLKLLLENGFTFDELNCKTDVLVPHPLEAAYFSYQYGGTKNIVLECFRLMFDHGASSDYMFPVNELEEIPVLFIYPILLGFIDIIPSLLQSSNLIDLDDLLKWLANIIFTCNDYPSYRIFEDNLIDVFETLSKYTTPPSLDEYKKPEYIDRYNKVTGWFSEKHHLPCLKTICRSVIRKSIHDNCHSNPHRFKIILNGLPLPSCLLSFLNYTDIQEDIDIKRAEKLEPFEIGWL
ncbi:uncharacterized protein LOC142325317 [Lycorma delicatula]|uniref:uncharacterized protein LOC142325317 n=1 Tax=Lycorma delicatula TaxID=130591 RepID=UPI003F513ADD